MQTEEKNISCCRFCQMNENYLWDRCRVMVQIKCVREVHLIFKYWTLTEQNLKINP